MSDRRGSDGELDVILGGIKMAIREEVELFITFLFQCVESIGEIDFGIVHFFVKAYRASGILILAGSVTDIASDTRIRGS